MHPIRALLVLLSLASPLLAQPRPLAPLRPVSVPRTGIAAASTSQLFSAGWNGTDHLVVWRDNRGFMTITAERRNFAHGQAMRISADGSVRQAITLPQGFTPALGVVWTGETWIVPGAYFGGDCASSCVGAVRISGEGVLLDPQPRKIAEPSSDPDRVFFGLPGSSAIAWTGSHIVMGVISPGWRVTAVVLNEELEITATHRLADGDSDVVGVATDGQTAMVVYRAPAETRAAVLDAGGALLRHERLFTHETSGLPHALTYGGGRYALALIGSAGAANSYRISLWDVSPELAVTALGEAELQSTQAFDEFYETHAEVIWDGTRYTVFATAQRNGSFRQSLYVAHFGPGGPALTPAAVPFLESTSILTAGVSAGEGSILFLTHEIPSDVAFELSARVVPAVEAIPNAPKQRLETGAFQQETPAAASNGQQSLVAWLERTDPTARLRLFAARVDGRGNVLDPEPLPLGEAFCQLRPGVASNGDGFVVAWHDAALKAVRIGADGSVGTVQVSNTGNCFRAGPVTLVGNGTDYLAAWASPTQGNFVSGISAAVLRNDGSFVTPIPLNLGSGNIAEVYPASDGRDYLVAWENRAVRITASGAVLDATPISLGPGRVRFLWWNGTAYVAAMVEGGVNTDKTGVVNGGTWRFVRIGANGTVTQPAAAPLELPELGTFALPFAAQCDAAGCTLPIATTRDKTFGLTLLRLADDGTNVTVSTAAVPNYAVPAPDPAEWPLAAGLLDAGEPIAVLHQMATAAPYHGVHRVFLARFGTPKTRAVRR